MKQLIFSILFVSIFFGCASPGQSSPSDEILPSLPEGYSTYSYSRSDLNPTTFYFDSVLGNNSNAGTSEGAPLKDLWTLDYINLVPGDTLKLKKGSVWSNNWIHITESGTNSNHILISTYGTGDLPSITATIQDKQALYLEGTYIDVENLLVSGTNKAAGIQTGTSSQYVTIDNCEIKNAGIGVVFRGADHLLQNSYVHDLHLVRNTPGGDDDYGANGVFIEANNIKVLHNRFENCKASSYDYGSDGGTIEVWRNCSNIEIGYNWSKRNNGFMEIGGKDGDSVSGVTVHHNIILNDIVIFLPHISGGFSISLSDIKYENNTVVVTDNNYDYSLFMAPNDTVSAGMLSVKNNIFYTVYPNRVFKMGAGSAFVHQYNLYNQIASKINYVAGDFTGGSGEITGADPLFVNLGSEDLHLQAGSGAVNSGTDLGYSSDYGSSTIPYNSSVEDMGCYESSY